MTTTVVVGRLRKPHGLKGDCTLFPLTDAPETIFAPGREVWLAFCTAGDRGDDILHAMGYVAARGAEHPVVAELLGYLRGRDRDGVVARLKAGAEDGGAMDVPVFVDEVTALRWMLRQSRQGDVVAVTPLIQRTEIFALLQDRNASRIGPARVRQLVRRARPHR